MNNEELPLVSVPVITYNSAKTVLETLESIKAQTYPNIELIISDDCSKDNTVEICREWIAQNKSRFVRTELLTIEKNTGVAGNLNRAEAVCRGEWVKGIAGDDVLMPNCVQDCVDYVEEHLGTIYMFGRCKAFGTSDEVCKQIDNRFDYSFFSLTHEEQLYILLTDRNCLPASTVFYNREKARAIGVNNDERIPLLEDWPKWINLLKAGAHFEFLDKAIVKYRISENALSTRANLSPAFIKSNALFYQLYRFEYEYEHGSKKQAIENWLRAQNSIKQNSFWHIVFKMYKICIMHKMH